MDGRAEGYGKISTKEKIIAAVLGISLLYKPSRPDYKDKRNASWRKVTQIFRESGLLFIYTMLVENANRLKTGWHCDINVSRSLLSQCWHTRSDGREVAKAVLCDLFCFQCLFTVQPLRLCSGYVQPPISSIFQIVIVRSGWEIVKFRVRTVVGVWVLLSLQKRWDMCASDERCYLLIVIAQLH